MKTASATVALLTTVFCALICTSGLGSAQTGTNVSGILTADTIWTKANSPYSLTGPVAVNVGATLTIESGATANLNGFYIQVNGTLQAQGTSTEQIRLTDGSVVFTPLSSSWNEQNSSGSIIANAVLNNTSVSINDASPKISQNTGYGVTVDGGSPVISNNIIHAVQLNGGSPTITYNNVTSTTAGGFGIRGGAPVISHNVIHCRIIATRGSPVISKNLISDGIHADMASGSITISNNEIISNDFRIIYVQGIHAEISNNRLVGSGLRYGIQVLGSLSSASIYGNIIVGCSEGIVADRAGTVPIVRNVISGNDVGIRLLDYTENATVKDNAITGNSVGIYCSLPSATIVNNNIEGNTKINFQLATANNMTVADNWWGTTDTQAINQSIRDFKNDFNLGFVSFVPFLTEPNPKAPPNQNTTPEASPTPSSSPIATPVPTQTPTASPSPSPSPSQTAPPSQTIEAQTPSPTPTGYTVTPSPTGTSSQNPPQNRLYIVIVVLSVAVTVLSAAVVMLLRRKTCHQPSSEP
ncbi:MAG: right-handed parallel beta-helix repeat-containing protein [Candidatus Bathyarchaeota archaeon]|nr:right-handed parallel beta-helix repeat-containing protein [Candidatus Bathyarchaeota archaeon]